MEMLNILHGNTCKVCTVYSKLKKEFCFKTCTDITEVYKKPKEGQWNPFFSNFQVKSKLAK